MQRAAVLCVWLLGACGAKPPERLETPKPIEHEEEKQPTEPMPAKVPVTPAVVIPKESRVDLVGEKPAPPPDPAIAKAMAALDVHDYERWPLGANDHPALEPAWAVAKEFAQSGVTWLDLCQMGAQNRRGGGKRDELEYLRGWCEVAKREPAAALAKLAPLRNSAILGMPAAVRTDIANIVVDAGDADNASRLLAGAQIDELAVIDLIAASYVEVGKTRDAMVFVDRAIGIPDPRRPAEVCKRLARKAVLVDEMSRTMVIQRLESLADARACATIFHELKCWHTSVCEPYLLAHGVKPESLELGKLYKAWPKPNADVDEWLKLAREAQYMRPRTSSNDIVISALESAMKSIDCMGQHFYEIQEFARRIQKRDHDAKLDDRINVLIVSPELICGRR